MNKILTLLILLIGLNTIQAQETIDATLTHDDIEREYILYVPDSYSADNPAPLLFNFHGYTSNATQQMWYGDFRSIADTAGFILVHPEGTLLNGITHWNVGGWTAGSTTDDIGFTEAMIDAIAADYNIDLSKVYATGMSNGGFLSHLLACQLSDKIAAIASVTGSMTPEIYDECDPQHPMPVLQIHGTLDPTVPYEGNMGMRSVDDVLDYWADFNNTTTTPEMTDVSNTNLLDLSTVEHFVYSNDTHDATVEHFKVTGGAHTWPGSSIVLPGTNYDIDASEEIWRFLSRYNLDDLNDITSTDQIEEQQERLTIYPNPADNKINVNLNFIKPTKFEIHSMLGQLLLTGKVDANHTEIDVFSLSPGAYLLKLEEQTYKFIIK